MVANRGKWGEYVDCPLGDCGHWARRNNMGTHLMTKHKWEREAAWAKSKELFPSLRQPEPKQVPAPVTVQVERQTYNDRMVELVDCPQGCGAVTKRKRLYQHLEAVHKIEHRAALRAGRNAPASTATETSRGNHKHGRPAGIVDRRVDRTGTRNKATVPAVFEPRKGTQGVNFTEIDPTDMAIAVIQSQVNGTMPTSLLPDVVLYVDHTRELVGKLRSSG